MIKLYKNIPHTSYHYKNTRTYYDPEHILYSREGNKVGNIVISNTPGTNTPYDRKSIGRVDFESILMASSHKYRAPYCEMGKLEPKQLLTNTRLES